MTEVPISLGSTPWTLLTSGTSSQGTAGITRPELPLDEMSCPYKRNAYAQTVFIRNPRLPQTSRLP